MNTRRLTILLSEDDFEQLHKLMGLKIVDKENKDLCLFKLCKTTIKQNWYREVIQAGMEKMLDDYLSKESELINKNED